MQKITRNSFENGVSTDVDEQRLDPNFYTEAYNLELVGDGKFFALRNMKGTTLVQDNIISKPDTEVLGVFENKYKIDTAEDVKCLTIFTVNTDAFNIFAYDTENDALYALYEEATPDDYITDDRLIDARAYAENGIDILYFTDNYNEIRQLRCEIPNGYTPNFLSVVDLSLQRYGANGIIELDTVTTGGSLLSGTYQFAYRMVDPDRKRFTKWSSLTNPVHVYNEAYSDSGQIYASGVGLYTDRLIRLDISPTTIELDNFDYFQIAVVENIYPVDITVRASLLPIEATADFISGVVLENFEYKANTKIDSIPIEDIVVDYSPIKTAKTLAIQQNRLLAGNITYRNLEYDNGAPTISDATVATSTDRFTDNPASTTKGYFRGEVYRFGIVYYDQYGNKSAPVPFDFSAALGNEGSSTDFKFPDRSNGNYSILDGSSNPRSLGLTITGITNHPSWAVGFEIVRAKRIKKVLCQTPVIPFTTIQGIGAFDNYPVVSYSDTGSTTVDSAQPMTSDIVYVPKNMLWPEMRKISIEATTAGTGRNREISGEAQFERKQNYNFCGIFPDESQYNAKEFNFTGSEELETVDFIHSPIVPIEFTTPPGTAETGGFLDTDLYVNIRPLNHEHYYFHNSHAKSLPAINNNQITASAYMENLSDGVVVGGVDVCRYSDLQTTGLEIGYKPEAQRMTILRLRDSFPDEGTTNLLFEDSRHCPNGYNPGNRINSFATNPTYDAISNPRFINEYTDPTTSTQVIRVANVINPSIDDNRYGDADSNLEYISTGTKYVFAPGEVDANTAINVTVWGGDCFVSRHSFKISDSTYSIMNAKKGSGIGIATSFNVTWWKKIFMLGSDVSEATGSAIRVPVGLKGVSQFVSLYMESEYNGEAIDVTIYPNQFATTALTQDLNRSPLTYQYNINVNKNNDQKIYFAKPTYSFERYVYGSRIQYSDIKIYNSPEQGFDIFRVGNFRDLEESGGDITKLAVAVDNTYSIQESRITYLPIGERQLETSDAGIISVGSSEVIGIPKIIDRTRGSQHLGAIVETGRSVLIPDNQNKSVYSLEGQSLPIISDKYNASYFRDVFGTIIAEKALRAIHDPIRKEYWIFNDSFCRVYNYGLEKWIGNYEPTNLLGGQFTNQNLYLLGKVANQIAAYTMYTGVRSQFFGTTVTPRVKLIVNPDSDFSKTFDDLMFVSTDRLDNVDLLVERESSLGNQTVDDIDLDLISREGNYRVKILRDSVGARLRGLRMTAVVNWLTTDVPAALSAVFTKYRLSSRTPF